MVHTPTLTTDKHKTWKLYKNCFILLNSGSNTDQYDKISSDQQPPDDSIAPVHIFPHGVLLLSLLTIHSVFALCVMERTSQHWCWGVPSLTSNWQLLGDQQQSTAAPLHHCTGFNHYLNHTAWESKFTRVV